MKIPLLEFGTLTNEHPPQSRCNSLQLAIDSQYTNVRIIYDRLGIQLHQVVKKSSLVFGEEMIQRVGAIFELANVLELEP